MKVDTIIRQDELEKYKVELIQKQKQEFKLLKTFFKTAGLKLYCYNTHKDKIEEVLIKSTSKTCVLKPVDGGYLVEDYERPKVQVNQNWYYFEALNMKSAEKLVNKFKAEKINNLSNLRLYSESKMKL